jgi:[ribosomal protein S5]-alanine N-acetyltransferase
MPWTPGTPVEIRTERFSIRSIRPADVTEEYISWFKESGTMQFIAPDMARWSREEHLKIVDSVDNRTRLLLIAEDPKDERAIGWVRAQLEPRHKRAQTSIAIGNQAYRGRGGLIEIHQAVRLFLFAEADIQKLTFMVYGANVLMLQHLANDPNVVKEGVLRRHDFVPGVGWQDAHLYAMFRDPLEGAE